MRKPSRAVDVEEIGANPRLALCGFIVRVLVDDLVEGLQRGRFTEAGVFVPVKPMKRWRVREIQCAVDAVADGRLGLFCDWLSHLSGIALTSEFFLRRAVVLARNPAAYTCPHWRQKRRDAERDTRRHHATRADPPDRRGLNADLSYARP